jgi:hypothetical protein
LEEEKWKSLATIILSVGDGQLQLIKKCKKAKVAWDTLKDFHAKSCLSTKVSILKQICHLQLEESGKMESHLFKMDDLFDKLAAAGKELDEDFKVAIILSSLPESYDVLTTALEARSDDDLTIGLVKQKLIDESRKRGTHEEALVEGSKALKIMERRNVECYYCHLSGHVKNRCYKWLELKEKEKQEEDEKRKREKEIESARRAGNFEDASEFAFCTGQHKEMEWCIDSGATSHMTSDKNTRQPNIALRSCTRN